MDTGTDSFDVVRLANQITTELDAMFGADSPPLPQLVEKLLDCRLGEVIDYMIRAVNEALFVHSHITSGCASHHPSDNPDDNGHADELASCKSGSSQISCDQHVLSLKGHVVPKTRVISFRGHVTGSVVVESWRRGQHFINGRYKVQLQFSSKGTHTGLTPHWVEAG